MGLEGVEILWSTEAAFGITITDAEAATLRAVEDLHLLVMAKLAHTHPDGTAVWAKILDIVAEETGTRRDLIKPGSPWREIGVR